MRLDPDSLTVSRATLLNLINISRGDRVYAFADRHSDEFVGARQTSEQALLETMAARRRLSEMLEAVCRMGEQVADGCRCGIYLIDWSAPRIWDFVAPNLPASFNTSLCGLPVHCDSGPCARAAYLNTAVFAGDLDTDPLWLTSAFRVLAAAHRLRSCWSTPIHATGGQVLGILAILRNGPGMPTRSQEDLISRLACVASIVMERAQAEAALARTGAKLERIAAMAINGDKLLGAIVQASERGEVTLGTETETRAICDRYDSLSNREREVMDLIVAGKLNKQVGGELGISEITVKGHRGRVMRKMRAGSFADLVKMAVRIRPEF
jgi:DNA-binding CsgD family transcriptional regulator